MSAQSFETILARLYVDPEFRGKFLAEPYTTLKDCNLSELEKEDFMKMDRAGLIMASQSFLKKRKAQTQHKVSPSKIAGCFAMLLDILGRHR